MASLDRREAATGRRTLSDSRLPLLIQQQQLEEATKSVVEKASRAFKDALKKELEKA